MEDIIQTQREDKEIEDVLELCFDEWKFKSFTEKEKKLIETYEQLDTLSLEDCGLESLENFPNLPNLMRLNLTLNKIKGNLESITHLSQLMQLSLIDNEITTIEDLRPLTCMFNLNSLDLLGCPITLIDEYAKLVFELIPSLEVLDGLDKDGEEPCYGDSDEDEINENYLSQLIKGELGSESEEEEEEFDSESEEEIPKKRIRDIESESEEEIFKQKH